MSSLTQTQIPDHSILDINGKQTYLGNTYVVNTNLISIPTASTETPLLVISNPITNNQPKPIGLFQFLRKLIISDLENASFNFATFKFYLNPTLASPGTPIIPANVRPSMGNNSVMTAGLSPAITGTAQVQTVTTVADVAGSLNNTYFLLYSITPGGAQKNWYVWFNVNSAGIDPGVAGYTGIEVDLSTGATANAVATAIRAELNALTSDFVATGATNVVIITNVNVGPAFVASEGAQPTGFTFQNTTSGGLNFGDFLAVFSVNFIQIDSSVIYILDPGMSALITCIVNPGNIQVAAEVLWYEL